MIGDFIIMACIKPTVEAYMFVYSFVCYFDKTIKIVIVILIVTWCSVSYHIHKSLRYV